MKHISWRYRGRRTTVDVAAGRASRRTRMEVQMSKAEFTALLVEFTAAHHCSRNWLETVVEWIHTSNDQVEFQEGSEE